MISTRLSLALVALSLFGSACIKTRSQLKKETENPDSGYPTQVTEAQPSESQRVSDELRGEINRLNGRIDDLHRKNENLSQDAAKRGEREAHLREMETKIQELQASQTALIDALQKKEQEREKAREVPKSEPTNAFEQGRSAYKEKNYDSAIESLTQYLKFSKGKNAEEAMFLRGESYFAKNQHEKAIIDYSNLQKKFPKSKSLPKALLKIGLSFEEMGLKTDAKGFYQELLDKYPKSAEAKTAKAKLK